MSGILIVADHCNGMLRPATLELVTAAQALREGAGGEVVIAVLGSEPGKWVPELSVGGVDEIVTIPTEASEFEPHVYEAAVAALIEARAPRVVLIPHSVNGLGYAVAVANRGGHGFTSDVFKLAYEGSDLVATRAAYGEKVHVEVDFPGRACVVLTVRAGTFEVAQGSASPSVSGFELPGAEALSRHKAFIELSSEGDVDITGAEFMLSIGRGVGEEDNVEQFKELADTLGATLGCSRPIADSGWLPKSRQVGQSGKTVSSCKVYLAMGISGSVQHMAGMKHVENIIAVNSDPNASIFSIARYGVVGDMFEIAEELRNHFG